MTTVEQIGDRLRLQQREKEWRRRPLLRLVGDRPLDLHLLGHHPRTGLPRRPDGGRGLQRRWDLHPHPDRRRSGGPIRRDPRRRHRPPRPRSAEWIAEAPSVCKKSCVPVKLADFGSVTFSQASANGASLASYSATQTKKIEMKKGSTVKAIASALSGTGFTVAWEHN